jgi:apolipoprotein N-acyltransferase
MEKSGDLQIYHKSKLVVGVEKMPFINYLGFLGDLVINIGGTSGSLGRQNEAGNFTVNDSLQIAPVICYESVFGAYVADYIRKGAGLIFIITNDGWWKNTPGYKQHFSFARLRAIETRRSIARSANTGISGLINQRGDVLQSTDWWKEGVIKGDLNVNREITFYVRYGDFIGRISAFISALLILFLISQKLLRKNYIAN